MTRYYYEGQNVILETDADEAPRRSFVHGSQYIDERVLMRLPTGQEYYYLPRELYSVAALTDETGTIVEAATYDTYGKVALYNGSAQAVEESPVGNPYYFTGRRLDLLPLAGGLKQAYHYRARGYDPGNGRFLQRDPLGAGLANGRGYPGEPNLYEYVRSASTRAVDPLGLMGNEPSTKPIEALLGYAEDGSVAAWFLGHYMGRSGQPVFLTDAQAAKVMDTLGVRLQIDNELDKALGKARGLKCIPPSTEHGESVQPVSGDAIAEGGMRVVIQQFHFGGTAQCTYDKTCVCCNDGSVAFRTSASCHFDLAARDLYDFHVWGLRHIPGVPYYIIWTWQTDASKSDEKKCKDGSTPAYPSAHPFRAG